MERPRGNGTAFDTFCTSWHVPTHNHLITLYIALVSFSAAKMKATLALLFLPMVSACKRNLQPDVECADGRELFAMSILLDATPLETGYSLVCASGDLWDVPAGSITSPADTWVEDFACVDITDRCIFSITDSSGNGLFDDGWYSLTYGATTIAVYDYTAFTEETYCFGSGCDGLPLELVDVECDPVFLGITFDSNPEDVGIFLTCEGTTLWSYLNFGASEANQFLTLEECVSPDACCTFTITDDENDGLTASTAGSFELEVAYDTVTSYDGESGLSYGSLSLSFGSCA
jgi:hypothetical protein